MNDFPQTLKTWRKARRFSQLQLAMMADVSSRHLSFLETGRARPSPQMIQRLGEALELPLSARNQLLSHAGFAARYPARQWAEADMTPIRAAIAYTLERHDPYPALALDRLWCVVQMNDAARRLFAQIGVAEGDSLLQLMMSDHFPAYIENWPEVAHHAALRLRTESAAQGGVAALETAAQQLSAVPGQGGAAPRPVVPTIYVSGDMRLSLFATIAQFGTPEDLMLDDLRIELYFPADGRTEHILRSSADDLA